LNPIRAALTVAAIPLYAVGIAVKIIGLAAKVAWLEYRLRNEKPLYVPQVRAESAYEKAKRDWSVN
jgi:hypothetical protein